MTETGKRILVVDDEESLCEILKFNLEVEGFDVDVAYSAEEALAKPLEQYSLILLDVMMEGMSGFKMAQVMKKNPKTASVPIIFCTAKDGMDDKVAGLDLGADDYIAKPFSIREVLARVKSVLRRTSGPEKREVNAPRVTEFETLRLDLEEKTCTVDGKPVELTKKEFEILDMLIRNGGRILSRDEILHAIWPEDVIVLDRTVDVNITRLRKKIGKYGNHIITRLGYGYGFES
jgi:two-component system alkaline phosphatase synthesis response regulator PhoP